MAPRGGRIVRCAGARAAQRRVLADVAAALPQDRTRARILIVVASADLREQMLAALARAHGALLGVRVSTLWSLARELLERGGRPASIATPLFDLLARRAAAAQPELLPLLQRFERSEPALVQPIRALLDAGLRPELQDAAHEAAQAIARPQVARRARALIDAALQTLQQAEQLGLETSELALGRAARLLDERGPELLGGTTLFVHGFADATGLGCELLGALRRLGAVLYVEAPPEPRDPTEPLTSLAQDLELAIGGPVELDPQPPDPVELAEPFHASGPEGEARELAQRLRTALDGGTAATDLLVVARRLDGHAVALRQQLRKHGIPFTGPAAPAVLAPGARRRLALGRLLERQGSAPLETWSAALADPQRLIPDAGAAGLRDLMLALRARGLRDLRELAELDETELRDVPLPQRSHDEDGAPRRRWLPRAVLTAARAAARRMVEQLRGWPQTQPLPSHAARLGELLRDELGWPAEERERIASELCGWPALRLRGEEFFALLPPLLEQLFAPPLGGDGGVRVTDALHARGLVATELFLLGLQRGEFPRPQREDPLLPDSARHALAAVLPALRTSARSSDEERQLFASLLSAAPRVQLAWQHSDADGRELARSPFLELLAVGGRLPPVIGIAPRVDLRLAADAAAGRPLPADEVTLHAALAGDLDALEQALAAQLRTGPRAAAAVARARRIALMQWDRLRDVPRLRSFFGKLPARVAASVAASPAVTWLENYATCPWRTWLARGLGLERVPDPLLALPQITPAMLGDAVHLALAALLGPDEAAELPQLANRVGQVLRLPDPQELMQAAVLAAQQVADREGVRLRGLCRVLAERVRDLVELALRHELATATPERRLLGVEVAGTTMLRHAPEPLPLRFRADRIDRDAHGLLLTDYKTGKPPDDLPQQFREGRRLQAAAYALAAATGESCRGRYLHLRPDGVTERTLPDDLPGKLHDVAATLLHALAQGWFPPRVENRAGDEPKSCDWCDFKEACIRGDSGMRRHLRVLAADEGPEFAALRRLWQIGAQT